jgi:hypothetical protein
VQDLPASLPPRPWKHQRRPEKIAQTVHAQ